MTEIDENCVIKQKVFLSRLTENTPLISVVVPVFNTENYVVETLQSIVSSFNDDYELIIVNDGSSDRSHDLILKWISSNEFNVAYILKENGGLGSARNAGASIARGRYITFFDSDDYACSYTYPIMVRLAESNSLDVIIARARRFSNLTMRSSKFGDHDIIDSILGGSHFKVTNATREGRLFRVEPSAVIRLYNKEFFDQNVEKFPEGVHFEDVSPHAASIARASRVGLLNECLLVYRIDRAGQITASKGATRFDILYSVKQIAGSGYISELTTEGGACLCGQLARLVHWCATECPKNKRSEFIDIFLDSIKTIPSSWWWIYKERYSENITEAQFCEFSATQNAHALKSLVGVNLEDKYPSGLSAVERIVFDQKSKIQIIKDVSMVPVRIFKRDMISLVKVPTRKIKNMMVGR
ncbi:glycosyltransferase family 2 protein [Brucella gallinifaecis]|nr:glycosyltransferase family 2 protein [Brucella gallinifaecis]